MEAKSDEGESKSSGGDEIKLDQKEVLQQVIEYATGSDFEKAFEAFAEDQSSIFMDVLDLKPGEEHPLEWHNIYIDYLNTFERKIEKFIESAGYNINDFYNAAKDIMESDTEFGEARFFLEALMATSEYEAFVSLMKGEMIRLRSQAAALSADADSLTSSLLDSETDRQAQAKTLDEKEEQNELMRMNSKASNKEDDE